MKKVFSVYVVGLDPAASRRVAPNGPVYVGETSLTPVERLAKHKAGGLVAARVVARHGRDLRPDLVIGPANFETRAQALRAEWRLARRLRNRGFEVFGGQGRAFGRARQGDERGE